MAFCRQCGKQTRPGAKFCPICGTVIKAAQPRPEDLPHRKIAGSAAVCGVAIIAAAAYFVGVRGRQAAVASIAPPQTVSIAHSAPQQAVTPPAAVSSTPAPNSPAASVPAPASPFPSDDMPGEVFPKTRQRILSAADIDSLSYSQVRYAINEMYARHGYQFSTKSIYDQFKTRPWYQPSANRTHEQAQALFSPIERTNMIALANRRLALQKEGLAVR